MVNFIVFGIKSTVGIECVAGWAVNRSWPLEEQKSLAAYRIPVFPVHSLHTEILRLMIFGRVILGNLKYSTDIFWRD